MMLPEVVSALAMLVIATVVDCCLGEYPRALHPVVWFGKGVQTALKAAPPHSWWAQFLFGALLALGSSALAARVVWLALHFSAEVGPVLEILVGAYFLKAALALRALGEAADGVRRPLEDGDVSAARAGLRSLCSRDPEELRPDELIGATIESLAENASDSVVAPLFYFAVLGVSGAAAYRALNTLDAMIGYRGRFEALGKSAARLDDVVNFLPARLTALLFLLAGWLLRKNVAQGWRILRRDASRTPSPNGGRPMAVMAGLLGVALEKRGVYILGDARVPLTPEMIVEARRVLTVAGWLAFLLAALATAGVRLLWELFASS